MTAVLQWKNTGSLQRTGWDAEEVHVGRTGMHGTPSGDGQKNLGEFSEPENLGEIQTLSAHR